MRKLVAFLAVCCSCSASLADIVYENDMSSLDSPTAWEEGSNAGNEPGPTTGGIRVACGGTCVQMNSWWDGAGWTRIIGDTGVTIQNVRDYTLTLNIASYQGEVKDITVKMVAVDDQSNTTDVVSETVTLALSSEGFQDYTVSFSTKGGQNDNVIGQEIRIVVLPDWWRNLGIDNITIDESAPSTLVANDPTPADGATEVGVVNGSFVDVDISWKTALDPNDLVSVNQDVTAHYVYLVANEPNFVGATPVTVSAGNPPDAMASLPTQMLNFDTTYWWRVDEGVNGSGPGEPNTLSGPTWSFTTRSSVPVIDTQPQQTITDPGVNVDLTIAVSSISTASYQWYRSLDPATDTPGDDSTVGGNSATLSFTPVAESDDAYYYCVVTNNGGSVTSDVVKLLVKQLVAHWKLDNNYEDSANNWDGQKADPNFVPAGIDGNAHEFFDKGYADGGAIEIPGSENAFNFYTISFTASCWVKLDPDDDGWNAAVAKERRETGQTWMGWWLGTDGQDRPSFSVRGLGGLNGPDSLSTDEWHLIAVSYDSVTGVAAIYADGVEVSSGNIGSGASMNDQPVIIGVETPLETVSPFLGQIDDVRIWNYAVDKNVIAGLMYDFTGVNPCVNTYASYWDTNNDCIVNVLDFADFSDDYLSCGLFLNCP